MSSLNNRTKALPLREKNSIEQVAATISKESLESITEILSETVYTKATELLQQEITKSLSQIEDHIEDIVEIKMQELLLSMLNGIKNGKEQFKKENASKRKKSTASGADKKSSNSQKVVIDPEVSTKIINTLQVHQELELKELLQLAGVEIQKPAQFMNQLIKSNPNIQKSGRSRYTYSND